MDDRDTLERLRRGDQSAFDALLREHYPTLVRFAEGLVGRRAVAEEVVQDVMLQFWRRRDRLASDSSPIAYLFQATRNRALNHLRHVKVERRSEPYARGPAAAAPAAEARMAEDEIEAAVEQALRELPARCREVFELSRVHGLKYAEIARVLGISVKTVEAQMGKALRQLRERLAPWLPNVTREATRRLGPRPAA